MTTTELPFLPYALPDIGEAEQAAVGKAMASGWVTTGPNARAFEQEFTTYLGGDVTALAVSSATAGLHLAVEAIGVGPGDEVIVPTLTFTATAEVVRYMGADPIVADIDPATLNIDPADIERRITARTKAIIVVHYGGLACDMDAILAIARRHGLRVIEDAAHAFPTMYRGALIGTLASDITVFSFYANKTMTTGEGGMVVTRDAGLAERMRVMRLHGINRDAFDRFQSKTPAWYYEVVAPGYKYNLNDMAAALGRVQLTRIDAFAERRNALARRYQDAFAGLPIIDAPRPAQGDTHAWHIYAIRLTVKDDDLDTRAGFIEALSVAGIGTSVHYIPLHRQPYWRDTYGLTAADYPHADRAYHGLVSLPLYTLMSDADQDRVIEAVKGALG
ncbi:MULTISPECIES: DegT/DnrJ/EryC1/StrS family aminotransferase [unclassified Sphingomonas]|uniref:DegT/DnrJ/EryC1/StrS family aminotransferase n=1 Tax=unclassified Sphingomonas TaxID=196159 RepID=UPI0006F381C5|nr:MULTISPECIES: DegT/DnrJ/EryC1/StrS aminotransferase family protein [unclassified Sphingomonas]KQM63544.1 UDP-4-amino-4,6-dideoxy-N-acetyl-beta-L-altrosamine transaminase [Sphingomonas sp. Leaf16]KQN15160.1 UDP-4-amino-4,6-dideoxy-N-acetyl-beta-L-altrosamine transaminase [Sphingomonas sp. Leaf29]KQN20695.1 UDP-4-amino-4,6-dideoxy-N-acetyl-beta-L-altrosamine transaminase [Sphingomonas sp. Leaf32]